MRTRFAPTPSGYLHQGNLANALVNSWLARQLQGDMVLRMDSDDQFRIRPEYTEFIFESLRVLGIGYTLFAPDLESRAEYLKSQLASIPGELLFACDCSRSSLIAQACTCVQQQKTWQPKVNALRLRLETDLVSSVNDAEYNLHNQFGDVVLWRRDDVPSYHWANVIDDRDLAITHIVRGSDLQASSALHIHIARIIGAANVANASYQHHSLILSGSGKKLSKSQQSNARPPTLDLVFLSDVHNAAERLANELGISIP